MIICACIVNLNVLAQYQNGDYIFTNSGKFKVDQLVDIAQPGASWNNFSSTFFSPYTAQAEDDYNGIQSTSSDEDAFISYALPLQYGMRYIVTMKIKVSSSTNTSITDNALNQIDAWLSPNDDKGARFGQKNIDFQQVATTVTCEENEWTEISWSFVDTLAVNIPSEEKEGDEEVGGYLNILFSRISSETVIATNMQVVRVAEVYDTRISDAVLSFVKQILDDPNFNTETAADARSVLVDDIALVEKAASDGTFDKKADAEEYIEQLKADMNEFMDCTSTDFSKEEYFRYISDLSVLGKYNRGAIGNGQTIGGFLFKGYNWMHNSGEQYWSKGIHGGYSDSPGAICLYNESLPAGKYYFSAEVRNAVYNSSYSRVFTMENEVKMFIGNDTISCGTIKGEQFVRFYYVGEIKEGETFSVGFWYPGFSSGVIFDIQNFELRGFGDVKEKYDRQNSWNTFKTQWNEAVNARKSILDKIDNPSYPWEQDSLKNALLRWDPLYNAVLNVWVDEQGNDLGTASNEELEEWAVHQGFYPEEENEADAIYKEYALVRGYQYTNNYVTQANKALADLEEAMDNAEIVRDDDINASGDKSIINEALAKAKDILDEIKANSNDERRETDEASIVDQIRNLEKAKAAFINSVSKLMPFIDIDFSGGFTPVYDEDAPEQVLNYVINGKSEFYPEGKGQMTFISASSVGPDNQTGGTFYQIGSNGVLDTDADATLRVGASAATVAFGEENIPGENDVIRAQFDLWLGNLSGKYLTIEFQNAAGERVGGFSINRYNSIVAFNDFNNQTGAWNDITESKSSGGDGLDIRRYTSGLGSSSVTDAAICVDANKSSFDIIFDYKANAIKGAVENPKNGSCNGKNMPMLNVYSNPNLTDNKIVKFVLKSDYGTAVRRCWFDNLKIFKYTSLAEGPIFENPLLTGDVNGDGSVNITDVVAVINTIASGEFSTDADINKDQSVNISDVVAIINIIAGID